MNWLFARIIRSLSFVIPVIAASLFVSLALRTLTEYYRQQMNILDAQTYHTWFSEKLRDDRAAAESQPFKQPPPALTPLATTPLPQPTAYLPPGVARPSAIPSATVSEDQLWQALSEYRQTHNRLPLVREEPLCRFARSRSAEHHERLKSLSSGESPLDGHAGFTRDADSGKLFTDTGFTAVAENLAFLPNYVTAIQVIEWGWDSSTSHRNTQLSNDWTHGCIAGTSPFYVGIFARR